MKLTLAGVVLGLLLSSCGSVGVDHNVKVEPTEHTIRVEPIQVTVDINVKVQVEEELDDLFDFREDLSDDGKGGGA